MMNLPLKKVSELLNSYKEQMGPNAREFILLASERYSQGILSPPISLQKIIDISYLLAQIDQDLVGNIQQGSVSEWHALLIKIRDEITKKGKIISDKNLNVIKQDILIAYRFHTISLCEFEPKGAQTDEMDELRAREFLQLINKHLAEYTCQQAFEKITKQLQNAFEMDFSLDMQALSRYLSVAHYDEYLKKFEEAISRKNVEFLGAPAKMKIFSEITKDKELFKQIQRLQEKSAYFKTFMSDFAPYINKKRKRTIHGIT